MGLDVERLRSLLEEGFWRDIKVLERVGSTNDLLKKLAQNGAPEGTVLIAEEQISGKGRLGRAWHSPKGGAWFSILLRPQIELVQSGCIGVTLAVGLAAGLRKAYQCPVGIKWPNDLWVNGRKLAGILVELATQGETIEWLVAGIGINVNNPVPRETRVPATSLAKEREDEINIEEFYHVALKSLAQSYLAFLRDGFASVKLGWQELSILSERVGVFEGERRFEASVIGLSDNGKLLVHTGQDVRELSAEEVSLCA